ERPVHRELLLAVEQARDVRAELAQQRTGVGALVAEGDRERRWRDDVAPLGGRADAIVEVEGVQVPEGPGELLDLPALDRDGVGRELHADDGPVELDRHALSGRL